MIFLLLSKWERPLSLYALSQSEADGCFLLLQEILGCSMGIVQGFLLIAPSAIKTINLDTFRKENIP